MKKILITMFAVMFTMNVFAQGKFGPDSAECVKYLSYYLEYVKQNNMPVVPVSLNFSRLDFDTLNLAEEVESCLKKYDIDKSNIHTRA